MWHIVECSRGHESACVARLARLGYPGGWWPQRKVNVTSGAKRRNLKRSKLPVPPKFKMVAYVPGYIFIPDKVPSQFLVDGWHGSKVWLRVLAPGGAPYRVSDAEMSAMRLVPQRIKDIISEAKRREIEAWEAVRPEVGKPAKVTDGPFVGQTGSVIEITDSEVEIDLGALISHIRVPKHFVQKEG